MRAQSLPRANPNRLGVRMMPVLVATFLLLDASSVILENAHVVVTRNAAPCASAASGCGDRVLVALSDLEVSGSVRESLHRGDIRVFRSGQPYVAPATGDFLEVTIKHGRPAAKLPAERILPEKNAILNDGDDFFVFEEKLEPGETRPRHTHAERLVVVLNATRLQQWPDGGAEVFRDQVPDDVHFNPPVGHVVRTVGEKALKNIVIEFKR
jgi:hypothetical protein